MRVSLSFIKLRWGCVGNKGGVLPEGFTGQWLIQDGVCAHPRDYQKEALYFPGGHGEMQDYGHKPVIVAKKPF